MKKFIENIRNSDETTKKIWLWVFTIGSAFLIVSLWLSYADYSIKGVGEADQKQIQAQAESPFMDVLKNGWKLVANAVSKQVNRTRDVNIQSANFNFVLEGLKKVNGKFPE